MLTRLGLLLTYLDLCWYSCYRIDLIQKYCLDQLRKILCRHEIISEKYSLGKKFIQGKVILNQNNISSKFFVKYAYWLSMASYAIFPCSQSFNFISANVNQNSCKNVNNQSFSCYELKSESKDGFLRRLTGLFWSNYYLLIFFLFLEINTKLEKKNQKSRNKNIYIYIYIYLCLIKPVASETLYLM